MSTIILIGLAALIAGPCEAISAHVAERRNYSPRVYRKPDGNKKARLPFHSSRASHPNEPEQTPEGAYPIIGAPRATVKRKRRISHETVSHHPLPSEQEARRC